MTFVWNNLAMDDYEADATWNAATWTKIKV